MRLAGLVFICLGLIAAAFSFTDQAVADTAQIRLNWQVVNQRQGRTGNQTHPAVAYDPNRKQLLLVWEDGRHSPGGRVDVYGAESNSDIYARLYRADDGAALGGEMIVADQGRYGDIDRYNNEQWPSVAYNPSDHLYHIVWMHIPQSAALGDFKKTTCYDVAYRFFDPDSKQFGPELDDVSGYRPPDELTDPWGNHYDWSCQQEPQVLSFPNGLVTVWWQDHRQRFDIHQPSGRQVSKDIYLQIIRANRGLITGGGLISADSQGQRLPMHQEKVDVAIGQRNSLVVWQDERNSTSQYPLSLGYRQVYGRLVTVSGDGFQLGKEIAVGGRLEGVSFNPKTAYMKPLEAYLVVWSQQETDQPPVYKLYYSVVGADGSLITGPAGINRTESKITQLPQAACQGPTCVMAYRVKEEGVIGLQIRWFNLQTLRFNNTPLTLSQGRRHLSYMDLTAGDLNRARQEAVFYLAYVDHDAVKLVSVTADFSSLSGPNGLAGDVNNNGKAFDRGDVICFIIKYLKRGSSVLSAFSPYDIRADRWFNKLDVIKAITAHIKQPSYGRGACLEL